MSAPGAWDKEGLRERPCGGCRPSEPDSDLLSVPSLMELESQVWCLEKEATELREAVEQQKAKNNVSVGPGRLPCGWGGGAPLLGRPMGFCPVTRVSGGRALEREFRLDAGGAPRPTMGSASFREVEGVAELFLPRGDMERVLSRAQLCRHPGLGPAASRP